MEVVVWFIWLINKVYFVIIQNVNEQGLTYFPNASKFIIL